MGEFFKRFEEAAKGGKPTDADQKGKDRKALPSGEAGRDLVPARPGSALAQTGKPGAVDAPATHRGRMERYAERADQPKPVVARKPKRVLILEDGTGSMAHLIGHTKQVLEQVIRRTTEDGIVELAMAVYTDYDMLPSSGQAGEKERRRVLNASPISTDPQVVIDWLRGIEVQGGGGNDGEAMELAFDYARATGPWDVIIASGDEPSNGIDHIEKHRAGIRQAGFSADVRPVADQLPDFKQTQTLVVFLKVGGRESMIKDFDRLAKIVGGHSHPIENWEELVHLLSLTIRAGGRGVSKQERKRSLEHYIEKYRAQLGPNSLDLARKYITDGR